jgi:hypothetical protein
MTAPSVSGLAARQAAGRGVHDLELIHRGVADPLDFLQPRAWCRHHFGEGTEFGDQLLGERLDIALGDGAE